MSDCQFNYRGPWLPKLRRPGKPEPRWVVNKKNMLSSRAGFERELTLCARHCAVLHEFLNWIIFILSFPQLQYTYYLLHDSVTILDTRFKDSVPLILYNIQPGILKILGLKNGLQKRYWSIPARSVHSIAFGAIFP